MDDKNSGKPVGESPTDDLLPPPPPEPKDDKKEGEKKTDKKAEKLELEELSVVCGGLYADAMDCIIMARKRKGMYPEDRAKRRGRDTARVLRKLGWDDSEIIAYVGLSVGVASDWVYIGELPLRDEEPEKPEKKDAKGAAA